MSKRIKDNYGCLDSLLGKEMICQPSVVKHLKGGHIKAYSRKPDVRLIDIKLFKRRKVIRLLRNLWKTVKAPKVDQALIYN